MWASMLHLIGKGGRVVTLDMNRPEQISWVETRVNGAATALLGLPPCMATSAG